MSNRPITPVDEQRSERGVMSALDLAARLSRFGWDALGVFLLALAVMTVLALTLPQLTQGLVLRWWANTLGEWFGWGSFWLILALAVVGLQCLRRPDPETPQRIAWGRVFALELAAFTSLILLAVLGGDSLERANQRQDGGRIGWVLAQLLYDFLAPAGLGGAFWRVSLLAPLFLLGMLSGLGLIRPLRRWIWDWAQDTPPSAFGDEPVLVNGALSVAPIGDAQAAQTTLPGRKPRRNLLPPEYRKNFRVDEKEEAEEKTAPARDERLPGLELLIPDAASRPDERHINLTAGLIEKTLAEFGIPARVVGFRVGPTVTQFAVEPGFIEKGVADDEGEAAKQKVRVAQISSLNRDLALALSAERLRIQAPVPGRPFIGIEVPNMRSAVVRLRPLLESEAFYKLNAPLALALGRDVSGQPVIADLGRMPHLLIAGTTGSGKSVCIAALTTCLVMNNSPEDLRLVMIDPKMVELVRFNGLPHVYGKVETDLQRILGVLQWTVVEMDRRYKLLEATRSRNLDSHNRKARRRKDMEYLPRIVVFIDELADLMMSAPEQTEPALVRLAQLARAVGIHLVVATQRPSTDVVTGLIKANFPARVSFAVASGIDSRVILDTGGAEALLGRGDMLFLPPEAPAPLRTQGAIISDGEIERVITYWQKQGELVEDTPPWETLLARQEELSDHDNLIEQAIEIVRASGRASASLLQRRLRVGYPRAARLIDELEDLGVIGPAQSGGRDREVLSDHDREEV